MSDRLLLATRKGLFVLQHTGKLAWSVAHPHFLGEPVSAALADPRDGTLYAALNLGHFGTKLHRLRQGKKDWEACAVPTYPMPTVPPAPHDEQASPAEPSLQQIWSLEAGGHDEPGVLWAGTIPGGLFRSDDGADSWVLNQALWERPERSQWFGGGYDFPGIHSICIDPQDSRHLTIAVSCGGVWQSHDAGASWVCTAAGMVADYMPPERSGDPVVQDPHRMVSCAAEPKVLWVQHHNGIFRSVDGGMQWQRLYAEPSSFGFAVAVHPGRSDTAWFVPATKDECRVPVAARFVVTRTRDGGRTFESLQNGLPQGPAYDLVYRHGLAVDASGERLAMGSTTGGLWVSEDGGDNWGCVSVHLPPIHSVRFA